MMDESKDADKPEGRDARTRRRTQVSRGQDRVTLTVPPDGLTAGRVVRLTVLVFGAAAALYWALAVFGSRSWVVPRVVGIGGGLVLLGMALHVGLRSLLDRTVVRFSAGALHVTHTFPWRRTVVIGREKFCGVVIGQPGLVRRGYFCRDWGEGRLAVNVIGQDRVESLGEGLSAREQRWLKGLIEEEFGPEESATPTPQDDEGSEITQPPEKMWRDVTRYSSYLLLVGLLGLALFLAGKARAESVALMLILIVFSGTAAVLGYRNYRLERAASRWHRAVIKSLASIMELEFSPSDAAGVGQELPDFDFYGGPRRTYNVAWGEDESDRLVLFDYTSAGRWLQRNGVGCALAVRNMSGERISIRPRRGWGARAKWGGIKVPEQPGFDELYCVRPENEGRARNLLREEVVRVISAWDGPAPRPWVCMAGGMVGLSIPRKHAENDRTMREFCEYARRVRQALEERITRLRETATT
ncbi:MAG: hypothetical protein PVJ27_02770 [Candidatus Brocadiaceae bacterium]|jgi:hypothetical protein